MKKILFLFCVIIASSCSKKESFKNNDYYNKAKIYLQTNNTDSAFYYFNIAKNEYLKINDSIGIGKSLVNMAIIQSGKNDFYGAIETSLEANKFLKREQDSIVKSTLAASYNCIAIASHFLKNYDSALDYHLKALKYSNDSINKLIYYNNIGDILITKGKFKEAEKYLEKAVLIKDSNNYSRALNNLAKAKYLDNNSYDPLPEFYKALEIRQRSNNGYGQNSSYETLSTYYLDKDKNLSLEFAKKMLNSAINNKSGDDQLTALQRIITLDPKNYLEYFQKYTIINDTIQTKRNKAKNQFAIVRYDVEQKNAQNQTLKNKAFKQNIGIVALIVALISSSFWYRKRQIRLKQEKELEVKNTEIKYSKKVHDKVANKVYHVMSEVENIPVLDKDELLDKLENIYHISRDISYDDKDLAVEKDFSKQLSKMLKSYSSEIIKVPIIGNEEELWNGVSETAKIEVFYILQELMTNMKKHSKADRVLIDFERENNLITISYSDNGVGIQEHSPKNGLRNTESRINSINGTINFESTTEKGLKINLSFPAKN